MKLLAKLAFAAVLTASAGQALAIETLQLSPRYGGSLIGGSINGYTPNPFPPYVGPRKPIPWPGPVCLSCPPFEVLKPGLDRRVIVPGQVGGGFQVLR